VVPVVMVARSATVATVAPEGLVAPLAVPAASVGTAVPVAPPRVTAVTAGPVVPGQPPPT